MPCKDTGDPRDPPPSSVPCMIHPPLMFACQLACVWRGRRQNQASVFCDTQVASPTTTTMKPDHQPHPPPPPPQQQQQQQPQSVTETATSSSLAGKSSFCRSDVRCLNRRCSLSPNLLPGTLTECTWTSCEKHPKSAPASVAGIKARRSLEYQWTDYYVSFLSTGSIYKESYVFFY